jgi:hypothetical protein
MRFRPLLWLALLPLLAASAARGLESRAEARAPLETFGISGVAETRDSAVRPAAGVAIQIVARQRSQHDAGGTGSLRATPVARRIASRVDECTAVRLATWRTSYATVAHGGPLIHFPTAPPLHG